MTNWNLVKPVLQNTFSFSQKLKDLVISQSKRMREGWGEKICGYKCILLEGSVQSMHFGSRHIPVFLRNRKYPQVQGKLKLFSLIFRFPRLPTSLWLLYLPAVFQWFISFWRIWWDSQWYFTPITWVFCCQFSFIPFTWLCFCWLVFTFTLLLISGILSWIFSLFSLPIFFCH